MNPRILKVRPKDDFLLILTFQNGEEKVFDMRRYLDFGVFVELKDPEYFAQVFACMGSISWPNGQDICPDTLYLESEQV